MLSMLNTNVLGEFELNADTINRLKESGKPEALTIDGEVQAIVIDAQSYQKLLEEADYAEAVRGIRQGMQEHEQGLGIPLREAIEDIASQKGMSLDLDE